MHATGKQERKVDLVLLSQKAGSLYVTWAHGGSAEAKVAGTSARVASWGERHCLFMRAASP